MSPQQLSVLIVGDEPALLRLLRRSLTDNAALLSKRFAPLDRLVNPIQQRPVDLLIVDI